MRREERVLKVEFQIVKVSKMSLQNSAIEKRRIGSSEKGEDGHGSRELKSKFNGSRESSSSSSSFYCLYKKMCDVHLFQARPPSRNSKKYRADDLCVNLVCEYFCWMLGDPPFFSADHFLF